MDQPSDLIWRLTVYFDANRYEVVDFDEEPETSSGQKIIAYRGTNQGRTQEAYVNLERATLWIVQALPAADYR